MANDSNSSRTDNADRFSKAKPFEMNEATKFVLASVIKNYIEQPPAHLSGAVLNDGRTSGFSFELKADGAVYLNAAGTHGNNTRDLGRNELVPAGTKHDDAVKMLHDTLGISPADSEKLYARMEVDLKEKAVLQKIQEKDPKHRVIAEGRASEAKAAAQAKAEPEGAGAHVILKPGDSVAALHATIPKDQRPPLEEFKQAFLKANPNVNDPNKVIAGKDYALPDKYNYEELRMAGRLIDTNIAALARKAVTSDAIVASDGRADSVAMATNQGRTTTPTRDR